MDVDNKNESSPPVATNLRDIASPIKEVNKILTRHNQPLESPTYVPDTLDNVKKQRDEL